MKSASVDIPVHDIPLPLEIHDYSIVWFLLISVCVLGVIFILLKKMRLKEGYKEVDERKQRYESLTHVDVTDAKKAAYAITVNGDLPSVQEVLRDNIQQILAGALPALEQDLRLQLTDELQQLLLKVKFVLP